MQLVVLKLMLKFYITLGKQNRAPTLEFRTCLVFELPLYWVFKSCLKAPKKRKIYFLKRRGVFPFKIKLCLQLLFNKTGLQPVSRPVEQILGFFQKGFKKGSLSKSLKMVQKTVQKRCENKASIRPVFHR